MAVCGVEAREKYRSGREGGFREGVLGLWAWLNRCVWNWACACIITLPFPPSLVRHNQQNY